MYTGEKYDDFILLINRDEDGNIIPDKDHDPRLDWYLNEQPDPSYPEHTNKAILLNQLMANNPTFRIDHENGNHTVWMSEDLRVVVSRCDMPTISVYQVERI
jgi:hypothetical protein